MKLFYRFWCIAAVLLAAVACEAIQEENNLPIDGFDKNAKGVFCHFTPIVPEDPATKGVDFSADPKVTFDEEDQITIWSASKTALFYTLTNINGSYASAYFDGGGFKLTSGDTYTSLYPAMPTLKFDAVPMTYTGQVQSAKNNSAHLKDYLYYWAAATCDNGHTEFDYHTISGFIQFELTFPEAVTINTVKLVAESNVFATAPTFNAGTGEIAKGDLTNEISITLKNGFSVAENETIIVYMAAAPFESATVSVKAIDSANSKVYTSTSATVSALESGKTKGLRRAMKLVNGLIIDASTESSVDLKTKGAANEINTDVGDLYVTIAQSTASAVDAMTIATGGTGPENLYLTIVDNYGGDYNYPCDLSSLKLTINLPKTHVVISAEAAETIGSIETNTSLNTLVLADKITVGNVTIAKEGGGLTVNGTITGTLSVPDKAAKTKEEPEKVWVKINETATVNTISVGEVNCNLYIAGNVGTVTTSAAQTTVDGNIATALTANESAEVVVTSSATVSAGATITANDSSNIYLAVGSTTSGTTQTDIVNPDVNTEENNTGRINYNASPVASVDGVEYMTFAKALAMVPTNGVKTTVKLLTDVALEEGFTVAATQNMVLDLNGFTLSEVLSQSGTSALITNNGTLVIQDKTDASANGSGTGKITYNNGNPDQASVPGYASNTIINQGNLTINSGYIENTTTGGYAAYTVDNITNGGLYTPTFTMNGGKLYNNYTDAVRMFLNSTSKLNKVVINGGILDSDKSSGRVVVMHDPNSSAGMGELDITGGTINGKVNAWSAANAGGVEDQFRDDQYAAISINISGGYIKQLNFANEMSNAALRASTLKVTGGYYNVNPDVDPEKPQVSAGYRVVESGNADFPFKVELTPAAKIGTTEYATLPEAVAAVTSDQTVTLMTDVVLTESLVIPAEKNFTLDLATYSISGSVGQGTEAQSLAGKLIVNNGTLTINSADDAGRVYNTNIDAQGRDAIYNAEGATIVINGGIFGDSDTDMTNGNNVNRGAGIRNFGTATLNGGKFTAGDNYLNSGWAYAIINGDEHETCVININDGVVVYGQNNGNIAGNAGTININGGEFNITGAKSHYCVYTYNATVNVTGGTFTKTNGANGSKYMFCVDVDKDNASNPGKINVAGGTFTQNNENTTLASSAANISLTGGTFNVNANAYCAPGYEAVEENSLWTVKKAKEAKIGETEYLTLTAAFDAVEAGQTITLLTNIDLPATIAVTKQVTLDLDEKTISNTADLWVGNNWSFFSVKASGNLTVTGNGTIDAKANDCYTFDVQDGGTLTIKNGTFTGNISCVYLINQANTGVSTCNIEGGTFSIKQLAPNVTEDKYRYLLNCHDASYQNNTARFNVTGGSFVNFNPANNLAEGAATNFCAAGYTATQTGEVWTVSQAKVAQVNGVEYATLAEAFEAVGEGQTITLLRDVTLTENPFNVTLGEKTVTLDLGTNTLTGRTNLKSGNLTIQNGNVTLADGQPLNVYGSATAGAQNYSVMTVASNVTVTGKYGVCLFGATAGTNGYGAVVNMNGTFNANNGVFVSGNLGNNVADDMHNIVNISGTLTSANDVAVALNGWATVNVLSGAQITGNTGIAVKRGVLNVATGATVAANGEWTTPPAANNSGTEPTGAAVSMTATYNNLGAMAVNIAGGTFTSANGQALYKADQTYTNAATFSVTGGTFSSDPSAFVAAGYEAVNNGDGTWTVQQSAFVAQIGGEQYETLAAAFAAVPDGSETTITMIADATVDNYITISANKNVVIELNGKTISSSVAQTKSSQLFLNRGTLTIQDNTDTQKDGTGHGKITYINSTPDSQTNYASNTITNNGVLTVKSGYIDNLCSGSQVAYTIDNQTNGGSYTPVFNFEGGKIYNNCTDAVRMFLNSTTNLNTVNISGGVIDSEKEGRIVCMQNANDKLNKGELNITGGVVTKSVSGWSSRANYEYSDEQYGAISINISGGRMHEFITTYMPKTAARADALRVTGGTFEVDPSDYVSAGYEAVNNGNGTWTVAQMQGVAKIGNTPYATLAEAIAAANESSSPSTITLLQDVALNTGNVRIEKEITLNLNGKTITNNAPTSRLFRVYNGVDFTIDGTVNGSSMVIPESNKSSYGFVNIDATSTGSTLTVNGGNYSGALLNGVFFKTLGTSQTVTLNNVNCVVENGDGLKYGNMTSSDINGLGGVFEASGSTASLNVNGGTFTSYSTREKAGKPMGIFNATIANVSFNNATIISVSAAGIEMSKGVISGSSISYPSGQQVHTWANTAIGLSSGSSVPVLIDSGEYRGEYGINVFTSGTKATIDGGTFEGHTAALHVHRRDYDRPFEITINAGTFIGSGSGDNSVAIATDSNDRTQIVINGGSFTGKLLPAAPEHLSITGGTFDHDPSAYVAAGYEAVDNGNGTWTVQMTGVAQIGDTRYASLAEAVSAAGENATIEVIKAGDYTIPAITKTLTFDAIVDGVVVNHTTNSAITTIASGKKATFKNMAFNLAEVSNEAVLYGFGTGELEMDGCTISNSLSLFGESTFNNCSFTASGKYNIWAVCADATFSNCTFTNTNRAVNVYDSKHGNTAKDVVFTGCTFTATGEPKKAAINIHHNPDGTPAKYNVFILTSCKTEGTWANSTMITGEAETTECHESGLWMISDITGSYEDDIDVYYGDGPIGGGANPVVGPGPNPSFPF